MLESGGNSNKREIGVRVTKFGTDHIAVRTSVFESGNKGGHFIESEENYPTVENAAQVTQSKERKYKNLSMIERHTGISLAAAGAYNTVSSIITKQYDQIAPSLGVAGMGVSLSRHSRNMERSRKIFGAQAEELKKHLPRE